jgi:two-component system cell cycle sensor histidine kinase/response regulator CckA
MTSDKIHVLLVEDNSGDARLAKEMLEQDGGRAFSVKHVETLEQAANALQTDSAIGLVLLDLGLPDESGLQSLRRIIPLANDASVVVMTGNQDEELGIAAIREGAHDFVTKGQIDGGQLRRVLRYATERQRMQRALRAEMTRRATAQEALLLSEERYRLLSETAPMGILLSNEHGKIVDANGEVLRLFGYSREELIGQSVEVLLPERLRHCHQRQRQSYMRKAEARPMGSGLDVLGRRKDGTEFPAELNIGPLTTAEGMFISATIMDVTSRKKLEGQLHIAQRMEAVGKLAGGVAHDFNNLLAVIVGCSDLILESVPPDHPEVKKVEMIRRAGLSGADLTSHLLAFSRQELVQPRVLELKETVERTEGLLQRLIGDNIDLSVSLESDLGNVKADPGQIEQIILNLAVNGRDAMPQGGRLTIDVRNSEITAVHNGEPEEVAPGRYVVLSVEDTGCGVDEQTLPRVFDPFYGTKPFGKGAGLGLATVYGIVKQSGGYICVKSEVGEGTAFKIFLPRVEQVVAHEPQEMLEATVLRGSETILVAEDSDSLREVLREYLESLGFSVLEGRSGTAALKTANNFKGVIDLLLTDVVMPGMSGVELARQLGAMHPQVKIIFISGYADDAKARQGILDSSGVFIKKPFRPKSLARKIRQVLDSPDRNEISPPLAHSSTPAHR